jgi:hypothetical protein
MGPRYSRITENDGLLERVKSIYNFRVLSRFKSLPVTVAAVGIFTEHSILSLFFLIPYTVASSTPHSLANY